MPRDFREYIAGLLAEPDPEAQAFMRHPRPYPGQRGVPAAAPLAPPPWAASVARSRQPLPHGGRLPRLSEIGPLLRTQAPPPARPTYQPPYRVIGPGGLTGDAPAPRVRLSEVMLPSFLPNPGTPEGGPPAAPLSPATFAPGTGQPAVSPPQGGQDDLDAAWAVAIQRVQAVRAAQQRAPRKR